MPVFTEEEMKFTRDFEWAALDKAVPTQFENETDLGAWSFYVDKISLGKAINLFGEAIDLLQADPENKDLLDAAHVLCDRVTEAINDRVVKNNQAKTGDSYLALGMSMIIQFYQDAGFGGADIWQARLNPHREQGQNTPDMVEKVMIVPKGQDSAPIVQKLQDDEKLHDIFQSASRSFIDVSYPEELEEHVKSFCDENQLELHDVPKAQPS